MSSLPSRLARRATITGAGAAGALVVVYLVAVRTPAGQRFEDGVLRTAEVASDGTTEQRAVRTLATISPLSLLAALAVVVAIALLRRRPSLAIAGTAVIAGSVLTAEVVQRSLLRPILLESGRRREDQSFPSGHAAVAAAVLCALVIVVPYRWRGWVVLAASVWAGAVGVATVTANWHRPSDTVGSDLIVLCYACAAIAILARRGSVREAHPRGAAGRMARGLLVGAGGVAGLVAVVGVVGGSALTAGRSIALAGAVAVPLTLLALLRRMDLTRPPPLVTNR